MASPGAPAADPGAFEALPQVRRRRGRAAATACGGAARRPPPLALLLARPPACSLTISIFAPTRMQRAPRQRGRAIKRARLEQEAHAAAAAAGAEQPPAGEQPAAAAEGAEPMSASQQQSGQQPEDMSTSQQQQPADAGEVPQQGGDQQPPDGAAPAQLDLPAYRSAAVPGQKFECALWGAAGLLPRRCCLLPRLCVVAAATLRSRSCCCR